MTMRGGGEDGGADSNEKDSHQGADVPDSDGQLPPLTSIWDCPYIVKCGGIGDGGGLFSGWKCGFCPFKADGSEAEPFCTQNATKGLWHVAKIKGFDIRPCRGFVPTAKARQYRMLYQSKAAEKDNWQHNRQTIASNNSNLQDQMVESLAASSGPRLRAWQMLVLLVVASFCHLHLAYCSLIFFITSRACRRACRA